ncbi:insulinoma-associated protein 1a [Hemiscyllium ocellatum]|uniref:insulinoma-associated protein 1a n=1 Tax=Hemiscyllium ocellatum TaxID=170820 RepID=UPI0029662B49|nr:insulinoma-associated protein 1a [Hemiscyllium ocellatum]
MPRGFLVKRNNKWSPVSYRIRAEDDQLVQRHPLTVGMGPAVCPDSLLAQSGSQSSGPEGLHRGMTEEQDLGPAQQQREQAGAALGRSLTGCPAASPSLVTATHLKPGPSALDSSCLTSSSSSSAAAAAAAAIRPGEWSLRAPAEGTRPGSTDPHPPALPGPEPGRRKSRVRPKKPRASRKLQPQDEVSTSPVLGLRIKADASHCRAEAGSAQPRLLAAYTCQLCGETYSDPFSLAQHRCSRIVRVEYRCPDCQKVFSCPANLASHRRWHKPRSGGGAAQERGSWPGAQPRLDPESKENSSGVSAGASRGGFQTLDSSAPGSEPSGAATPAPQRFERRLRGRRFRRPASPEKPRSGHQAAGSPGPRRLQWRRPGFPCPLCGVNLPSVDSRSKHLLWHAVSRGEPAGLQEAAAGTGTGGQLLTCKHCPSSFLSSASLSRHLSKCHPSENRQLLLLLQLATGPGC